MLKITVDETETPIHIRLEGKLAGAYVDELERVWNALRERPNFQGCVIDLKEATCISREGKELLHKMHVAGSQLAAKDCLNQAVIKQITVQSLFVFALFPLPLIHPAVAVAQQQTPSEPTSPSAAAAPAAPLNLSLKQAVQLALKQNPQVILANLNVSTSRQNQNLSKSNLLPQVNAGFDYSVSRINPRALLGTSIAGFPGHLGPFWVMSGGVSASMPVFDLTLWKRYQASKQSVNASSADELTDREQSVLLVVSQYLGAQRALADVQAAQSRVDLAQALYDQAADLQRSGVGTGIDTLRANVELQNEKQRLISAKTTLETTVYGLAQLLNLDPRQPITLADQMEFGATPQFEPSSTVEAAWQDRPELKALSARLRSAELSKQANRASRLPSLHVSADFNQQGLTPTTVIPTYTYAASLNIPIYTGGRIESEIALADIDIRKLKEQEEDIRTRIAVQVQTALKQVDSARSEVDVANLGVTLAREELTQASDRFKAGVANNVEVITAQDALARANDNQIAALYRFNQARADLAHAGGRMEALYGR